MNIFNYITVLGDTPPVLANNGYSLDVLSPKDICVKPGAHVTMSAGFILKLPNNLLGMLAPKARMKSFVVTHGQMIHPNHEDELSITLKYSGFEELIIKKGEPLCQIVLVYGFKMSDD